MLFKKWDKENQDLKVFIKVSLSKSIQKMRQLDIKIFDLMQNKIIKFISNLL